AEAIAALAALCEFAVGLASFEDARLRLGVFLTACTRGRAGPLLPHGFARGGGLPRPRQGRGRGGEHALRRAAEGAGGELVTVACQVWRGLGITGGGRPWQRASLDFVALARSVSSAAASADSVGVLAAAVGRRRPATLVEFDATHGPPVQLMNFHQTKGR